MPIVGAKGAQSSQGFGQFALSDSAVYIENVFSTWLYTGTGSAQTIANGIDLAGKGGLVWQKLRNSADSHYLVDTARGSDKLLYTDATSAQGTYGQIVTSFDSTGFSTGVYYQSSSLVASWTFRKQPKFFDVVTWTGTGGSKTIAHNLGSAPGVIIAKDTANPDDWYVYHRSLGATQYVTLNTTNAAATASQPWNNTAPTSTEFTVGGWNNNGGSSYVAYLFAHNAGGFGLTGTDNVISCGSYTGNGSASGPTINLGYEPQWLLVKLATSTGENWTLYDVMRGMPVVSADSALTHPLFANDFASELNGYSISPQSNGFRCNSSHISVNGNGQTYIYIAIRRGPMKTPTSGTSVFSPEAFTGDATSRTIGSITTDLLILRERASDSWDVTDRLRGTGYSLVFNSTAAEANNSASNWPSFNKTQLGVSYTGAQKNQSGTNYIDYLFRRAPGFFDEVCYTGTGGTGSRNIEHNLTAAPQLLIIKQRSTTGNWIVYNETIGAGNRVLLNTTAASGSTTSFASTAPTASVFTVDAGGTYNTSGTTYVAYLFASCPGVSKVGSYSGTGATQTISCGFAARFVLIKRTDSTGDWWVWDTARGMVAGTDPRLALNSTAAETNANWVYTDASGFQIVTTDATVNASGGSYIYLAIS